MFYLIENTGLKKSSALLNISNINSIETTTSGDDNISFFVTFDSVNNFEIKSTIYNSFNPDYIIENILKLSYEKDINSFSFITLTDIQNINALKKQNINFDHFLVAWEEDKKFFIQTKAKTFEISESPKEIFKIIESKSFKSTIDISIVTPLTKHQL